MGGAQSLMDASLFELPWVVHRVLWMHLCLSDTYFILHHNGQFYITNCDERLNQLEHCVFKTLGGMHFSNN